MISKRIERLNRILLMVPFIVGPEGFPVDEAELAAHHNPTLLKTPRIDLGSFLPGDYIDFYMFGSDGKLMGFIEVLETKDGRLPSKETVRWIELVSRISAAVIQPRMHV